MLEHVTCPYCHTNGKVAEWSLTGEGPSDELYCWFCRACDQDFTTAMREAIEARLAVEAQAETATPPPSVDKEDMSILRGLAEVAPRRLRVYELEELTSKPRVSRRTISERLPALESAGLVKRRGERGGLAITERGLEALAAAGR